MITPAEAPGFQTEETNLTEGQGIPFKDRIHGHPRRYKLQEEGFPDLPALPPGKQKRPEARPGKTRGSVEPGIRKERTAGKGDFRYEPPGLPPRQGDKPVEIKAGKGNL
jgi:hypothetical protein